MLKLRPYQRESIDALYEYWRNGGGNGLIVIPTGGGKSLVIASLLRELIDQYPLMRIGMVTHVKELIIQNFQELLRVWPSAPAGIYSAGVGRRDTQSAIMFMGIQSVWNKTDILGKFDLILVDEAHLISKNSETMYGKFLESMAAKRPGMRVVGLTATPYRLDSGLLHEGENKIFDSVVYESNIYGMICDGYLSTLTSKCAKAEIDVSGVHKRGGDYIPAELERAAMHGDIVSKAALEIVKHGQGRMAWLCFCTGLEHSEALKDAISNLGISAETVDGTMSKQERDGKITGFKNGRIKCLISVNVLSIGFNVPKVDLIAMLRPTASPGLYVQQVGRGLRLTQGKKDCLVLDFAGNVKRHGPIDFVDDGIETKSKENGDKKEATEMKAKECPQCESLMHPRTMECRDCGYVFPQIPKHEAKPDVVTIISGLPKDDFKIVEFTTFKKHFSNKNFDAPPTLMLTHEVRPNKIIREWLCFSHVQNTMPQRKAASWWLEMGGKLPIPKTVDEALARKPELKIIERIKFEKEGGFHKITGRIFYPKLENVA